MHVEEHIFFETGWFDHKLRLNNLVKPLVFQTSRKLMQLIVIGLMRIWAG